MATMPSQIKRLYEFGPFRLDPQKRILLRGEDVVPLTPKALETLVALVENRDRVVLKDDLMKMLWPDSFVEESNLSQNIFMLRKALGDSAQERRYILTVPGRGYQFTETVREIGEQEEEEALVVETHSLSQLVVEHHVAVSRWLWVGLAVLLIVGTSTGFLVYRARHKNEGESTEKSRQAIPPVKLRRSVAVLGFRNLSRRPESEWLSTALAEMLSTELAAGEQLRIIPGDEIASVAHDQSWREAGTLQHAALARLHSSLGTDYVAHGSYTVMGEGDKRQIRLDFRLQDAVAGEIVSEDAVSGSESDLFELVFEAGSRMRERLTVGKTSREQEAQVRASLPKNPKAARLYAEGLAKLREFEAKAASDLLTEAAAADPESAQVHAALGSAWQVLGYTAKATAETQKAVTLSENLRTEEKLSIEGQYLQLTHDWPKAIQIYRTLSDLYPDDLDYGLRLAKVHQLSGASKESVATLEACRKLPSPIGSDPRIDVDEATVLNFVGDFRRAQQLSGAAVEKGKLQHAPLVVAQALREESRAFERLGDLDHALAGLSEAKILFAAAGDLNNSARTLHTTSIVTYDKGDYELSRRQAEEALLVFRKIGNPAASARALEVIGNALYEEGKLEEAKKNYEDALRIDREIGSSGGLLCSELGNIANVLDGLGDLAGAQKMQEQVLQMFEEAGDKRGFASTKGNLGIVLEEQGDLAGAAENYQRGLQLSQEIGYKDGQGFDLYGLADVSYQQDDLKTAQQKAEQALALRNGETGLEAESLTQLALVSLDQGQPSEAEKFASDALRHVEAGHAPETAASAYAILALAQLAGGKTAEARKAAGQAVSLAAKASNRPAQFDAALAASQVSAAEGKFAEARQALAPVLAQTSKFGYRLYLFQARLILAEIAMKSGQPSTARTQLATLEGEARDRGFLLIARKAATARG